MTAACHSLLYIRFVDLFVNPARLAFLYDPVLPFSHYIPIVSLAS